MLRVDASHAFNADKVSPAGLANLAAAKGLEGLILAARHYRRERDPLGRSGLIELTIEGHGLTDAGLAFLAGCKSLQRLVLANDFKPPLPPRLTGAGFVHLSGLPARNTAVKGNRFRTRDSRSSRA